MAVEHNKIRAMLSSRGLPADDGNVRAVAEIIDGIVKKEKAQPVPESRLGVYLNHNFFDDWPLEERAKEGPVPATMRLLDELKKHRADKAAAEDAEHG